MGRRFFIALGSARYCHLAASEHVADQGDVVALSKAFAPSFGDRITDFLVNNGAKAHDVKPYVTAVVSGRAVAAGLHTRPV
ncbi:hypothetical protein [Streptantibioticus ferralitis]|uniref:Uncharacterized protein n=1 Tax=Streptantibioticus ferralitis TaxID=236510 RepID=A0ABT5YVK4_9ACTN|nr:hypothetical protein [Streptantibioticus ferralitis]MDF2255638.1 hypothetical protein [Streptantibioticus ferralitis]